MENLLINLKSLKINHGAVRRLFKELCYYEKEEQELKNKLSSNKGENKSPNQIASTNDILQETTRVLAHTNANFQNSLKKLIEIINTKFTNILKINTKNITFCSNYSEENLKEKCGEFYEDIFKEVNAINETLQNIFEHIKDMTLPICNSNITNNTVTPQEDYVEI
ncbi:tubulin-specific chaperone a, putative [Plasmodium berghei]|uniref:Tubulin-specific chaperone A n=2 Tax=Plasmodium berghei TaxID=5821 RepID=A0A509AE00_PLABA|nr:tubulin-specific chaperone a, putative [Plasmodium berghei ANKA]CXH86459.1 tubulin-specific chaperone a, putative [Plasmodium berghei]SCL89988.1 tubulin-specific chaperone a, putative [Plasmodium berghei]SCM15193.1 tubulin-specific chaperone a, putative [Plasmodium berghei]SCM16988.1 tubulin-specific chaperone a, putative [Plasmodium berghei]SCN21820.1 tubulin-specific chaperone a, putative [Plasmodium berghei]|eukprot:XP_034419769.1 tubulin-specific chaperone a, putative [Plasmodium berghei ANKA]